MKKFIKEKKMTSIFLITLLLLILKFYISKNLYDKIFNNEYLNYSINYSPDERVSKGIISKKNLDILYDAYFFGTSTSGTFNPRNFKNYNFNSFNFSLSGASIADHIVLLEWILKNKKKPKIIFLELKAYNFYDHEFKNIQSPEFGSSFNTFKFFLTDFSTINFYIDRLINFKDLSKNLKQKISYFFNKKKNYSDNFNDKNYILLQNEFNKLGIRFYKNYFKRQSDKKFQKINNNIILNKKIFFQRSEINEKKIKKLKYLVDLLKVNKIKLLVFFGPAYKNLIAQDNYLYAKEDLKIIKYLISNDILDQIYYFTQSHFSNDISNFELDMIHYSYDVADQLLEHILNDKKLISDKIINKNNIKNLTFINSDEK